MLRGYDFRAPQFLLGLALAGLGGAAVWQFGRTEVTAGRVELTSISLLLAGLLFYVGVLVLVAMFRNETYLSVALLLPSMVAIGIFVYGFIAWSVRVSLSKWVGLTPDFTWAGLEHYANLIQRDPRFAIDVRNTAVFTVGFNIGCLIIGLGLAILLDQRLKGESIFRAIFLFPMSISFIASGVVWAWLMSPAMGDRITGINLIFQKLNLDFLISHWHSTPPPWGMAFTVIPAVWQLSGFTMALYLGGLRSIPEEMREAARVDGASELQIYRHIILPMLQPVTLSAVIILGHMSLKIFDLIVALGRKDLRLDVPGIYMWTTTFDATKYAQGAAIGILMLISVAILVVPNLVYNLRTESET